MTQDKQTSDNSMPERLWIHQTLDYVSLGHEEIWDADAKAEMHEYVRANLCRAIEPTADVNDINVADIPEITDNKEFTTDLVTDAAKELDEAEFWAAGEFPALRKLLANPSAEQQWLPIDTRPQEDAYGQFLVLLPKNAVADYVVLQVSIYEGRMYPDGLDGNIDWDSAITTATHWRQAIKPPEENK